MIHRLLLLPFACVSALLAVPTAQAQAISRSNEAQAVALLAKARVYLSTHGLDKAVVEFNRLDSPFNSKSDINPHGDLYLYSVAPNGLQIIHGKNPKIRGKVMLEMRDSDGFYLIREFVRVCFNTKDGKGWVAYKWPNPVTQHIEPKRGYVERVTPDLCLGTGIYQ
jgi:cytochrome c